MRLRTKYALVLLGILLVLGLVVAGSTELFKQQTIEQEQAELDDRTQLAANQVDNELDNRIDIIQSTAVKVEVDDPERTSTVLGQMVDNSEFFATLLIDNEGEITGMYGDVDEEEREATVGLAVDETSLVDHENVFRAIDGYQTTIDAPKELGDDNFVLIVTAPILKQGDDGEVRADGAVAGALVLDPDTRGADVFDVLLPLETDRQTTMVTGANEDEETIVLSAPYADIENTMTSEAEIANTGWTLTVERDESALTSQLQFLQFIQFGSLLVVLLTVFGLGFYQYRTTLRQTDQLLDGFEELTDGNFEHELDLEAAEEWSQIGEGFNTMTDDLRTRERQIRERERRLSVLNRVLRHNLQNDMTVIQGFAEVIPTMDDQEQRRDAADKILEKSRGLVDHGKKARRLETVMENAEKGTTEVDIEAKAREALETYEAEYPEFAVGFGGTENGWVDAVAGVEFGIEQLVENAFAHNTSDDPRVEVTVERENEDVVVTVQDNGPGIPEHEREVLVQDEETSLEHGSGIGLWLAYWAIIKSGGDIAFGDQDDGGHVRMTLHGCEPPAHAGEDDDLLDL